MTGEFPERFFNLCAAAGLEIWDVVFRDGQYRFCMGIRDVMSCRPYLRKAKVRLVIVKKAGLPFFLHKNRKRKLWAAGFLAFFTFLYVLSFFVWDIGYQGNVKYTDNELTHYLDSLGIRCGVLKNTVSCEELEEALRGEFNGITWVSARLSGTRLYIQVKENDVPLELPVRDDSPCDLAADADGIITSIIVRSGVPLVKPGDAVSKGQLLVSGRIPIIDDAETVVAEHYVHADADILAIRSRIEAKEISLWYRRQEPTGKVRKGLTAVVGSHSFVWLFPNVRKTEWQTVTNYDKIKLFGDFYLPLSLGSITSYEVSVYEERYTQEQLEQMAQDYQNEVIENLMEKGVQILENDVRILVNDSTCRFEVVMTTEESIKVETQGEQPIHEYN